METCDHQQWSLGSSQNPCLRGSDHGLPQGPHSHTALCLRLTPGGVGQAGSGLEQPIQLPPDHVGLAQGLQRKRQRSPSHRHQAILSLGLAELLWAPTRCYPGFCQTSRGGASRACGSQPRKGLQLVLPTWHQLGAVTPKEAGHTRLTADGPVSDRMTYPSLPHPALPCGHLWPVPFLSQLGPGERSPAQGKSHLGPGRASNQAAQRHLVWPCGPCSKLKPSGEETIRLLDSHPQHTGTSHTRPWPKPVAAQWFWSYPGPWAKPPLTDATFLAGQPCCPRKRPRH